VRTAVLALLVAVPLALVGWVAWRGTQAPPPELLPPAKPAPKAALDPDQALKDLLAGNPGGAKVKEKVELYDDKGLFDYIDGGAPAFIDKHFRKLAAAEMAFEKGELTCDVYDMVAPENAAAIFASEKGPSAKPLDGFPNAVTGPMSLVFHAGRYYVKLTAFDKAGEAGLPELAKALKAKIP
jgi:hypothetical protein